MSQVTDEFKKWILEWVDLDDTVKNAHAELRKVKERQKQLENMILTYMKVNKIEDIGIQDGTLEFRETVRKTALSRVDMIDLLDHSGMLKSDVKADQVVEYLYSNRREKESSSIKRINKKEPKSKK